MLQKLRTIPDWVHPTHCEVLPLAQSWKDLGGNPGGGPGAPGGAVAGVVESASQTGAEDLISHPSITPTKFLHTPTTTIKMNRYLTPPLLYKVFLKNSGLVTFLKK